MLQPIFETEALRLHELVVVLLITPAPFIAVEIEKWFTRRAERHAASERPELEQAADERQRGQRDRGHRDEHRHARSAEPVASTAPGSIAATEAISSGSTMIH